MANEDENAWTLNVCQHEVCTCKACRSRKACLGRPYSTVTVTAILNAIIHILGCDLQLHELNHGLALKP